MGVRMTPPPVNLLLSMCEHSYWTNTSTGKKNRTETVKWKFAYDATIQYIPQKYIK